MNAVFATVQALLSASPVTALVGTRISPEIGVQDATMPDIIVCSIANLDTYLLSGPGKYPNARVRVECRAATVTAAISLGDAVIAYLDGLGGTFDGMAVTSFLKSETDTMDHNEDHSIHRRMIDFHVRYRAAT